jgi:outer membrane protein
MNRSFVVVAAALLAPSLAFAQSRAGSGQAQAQQPSMSSSSSSAQPSTSSGAAGGTTGLRGLRPVANPRTISLDDAFGLAIQQSWDLRIAQARIDEAQARVRQAWAAILPNISAGGQYTFNYPEQKFSLGSQEQFEQQALLFNSLADLTAGAAAANPDPVAQRAALERAEQLRQAAKDIANSDVTEAVIQPAHVFDGQIQLQVPLFNARSWPMLQNAYGAVDITRIATRQARAAVIYGVARTYYQAVAAKRIVDIAHQQQESAKSHRDLAQQRVDEGLLTPLALQRAELDLARADQQAKAAEGGLKMAKAALGSLIGVVEDFDVADPPAVPAVESSGNTDELLQRAWNARDDLRVEKETLAIAERGRTDAWMRFLPVVALTASGRGTTNVAGLVSQPFSGAIGVAVSIPIFDGGLTLGAIDEANAKLRQEYLRVAQLEALVEQEVRGTVDDLQLKKEAKDTAERVAALAHATLENTDKLFEAGAATSLDVTDARLGAFSADVDAARARFDLETARLALAYSIGELRPQDDLAPKPLSDEEKDHAKDVMDKVQ